MELGTGALIAADLTLDVAKDPASWWVDGPQIIVLIGNCDGTGMAKQ